MAKPVAGEKDSRPLSASLLQASIITEGYAVVWGAGTGELTLDLARQSKLRLIVIEPDADKAHALRRRLADSGVIGERVSVYIGDPLSIDLPPYLASLITSESLPEAAVEQPDEFVTRAWQVLRPYGGSALPAQHDGA